MKQGRLIIALIGFLVLLELSGLRLDQKSYAVFVKQELEHKALLRSAFAAGFDYSESKSDIFER